MGTGHEHGPGATYSTSVEPPIYVFARQRALLPALEDKILQRAVVEVLNSIYEADFLGFSYGFRPGRSPHDALDALAVGIERSKVNWVLDADIRDFFSQLDRVWLERFLRHRIADRRVLRLIQKWLAAGVIEDGEWSKTEQGTAQGASVSPLLANVYLHVCPQGKRGDVEGRFVIRAVPVMEVGPPGSPCRRGAQTAVMSCRSKAGVGSDYGNGSLTAGQVCDEKTNVVEPLLTHRKTMTASQPGLVHISGRASCDWAWCSQRTACVSLWRCSVLRWRELVVGAGMEEENLCLDTVGLDWIGCWLPFGREREDLGRQKPFGAEYREAQGRTGS